MDRTNAWDALIIAFMVVLYAAGFYAMFESVKAGFNWLAFGIGFLLACLRVRTGSFNKTDKE